MISIKIKENESFDVALRKFKRIIDKIGLLTELRAREFYEKPTAKKKRKFLITKKKHHKKIKNQRLPRKLY